MGVTGDLTIAQWRERVKLGYRRGTYGPDKLRVRVKRVWPNRLDVAFLDPRSGDEYGPAARAGRVESVHPADVTPLDGLW